MEFCVIREVGTLGCHLFTLCAGVCLHINGLCTRREARLTMKSIFYLVYISGKLKCKDMMLDR